MGPAPTAEPQVSHFGSNRVSKRITRVSVNSGNEVEIQLIESFIYVNLYMFYIRLKSLVMDHHHHFKNQTPFIKTKPK